MHTNLNRAIAIEPVNEIVQPGPWPVHHQQPTENSVLQDHFVVRDGLEFAGTHLILDFWEATSLNDIDKMEKALRKSIIAARATLLHIHLHHFTPFEGISGVAVLAESHISVHTWPERHYAAFDIFMCGDANPEKAIPVLKRAFKPGRLDIHKHLRGVVQR